MVFITPFLGAAALLSSFASAAPLPDSSLNEPAVSAPNGIPITDTSVPLASTTVVSSSAALATDASSNYGSSGSSSYGSSSSGSYGSSDSSGYGSVNDVTSEALETETSSAWSSYSTPSYGSGSSSWGGSGYDNCVSQCLAQFGSPAASYMPPTMTSDSAGSSSGNGATHTVIVAPSQGVLRYVPFAVNASVGDTVMFMWGANNHTVTKSGVLTPCNASSDSPFASGIQLKDFVFTQVVNDTNPVYFHCAFPGHCQKGMFGVINPSSSSGSPSSFSGSIQDLSASNPDLSAYAAYTTQQTANNTMASKWGGNIDISALPDWAHESAAENILYTRNFLAANAEVMAQDGSVDLGASGSTPLMIPQDVGAALNNAAPASAPSTSDPSSASAAPAATASASTNQKNNGASSLASPRAFVAFFAAMATFFVL